MEWAKIMDQVYAFLTQWWQKLVILLQQIGNGLGQQLTQLARQLEVWGVPAQYSLMVSYGAVYLLVTLVMVLVLWRLLRRRLRRAASPRPVAHPGMPEVPQRQEPEPVKAPPLTLYERMRQGLAKTHDAVLGRLDSLLSGASAVDDDLLDELEEILITADFGVKTTQELMAAVRQKQGSSSPLQIRDLLKEEIFSLLSLAGESVDLHRHCPFVLLVVGVNGVGKTTTIGKLAHQFKQQGKKVVLGAGDTFRAAAADQLAIWGERADVTVIRHDEGADPAAVAFDAAKAAVARKADLLILDTAGRLHTKVNLMEEMKKIHRVLGREIPHAPHETLLVLDATTGQNALVQARLFQETVQVSGIALTKLDGTAKGGMAVAIAAELGLPVRYVGIGEGIEDLRPFDARMFVDALFDVGEDS
ncbi:MAG: signal recognition particle-docking protein FtsY [Desulfuromonadaceae bacterium]|nr:signal recognition particle-docking protein FtsY [Desulfuromonadaceae bacterium]